MRRHALPALVFLLACAAAPALGAQVLRPGSGVLAPERIRAGADTFDMYFEDSEPGRPEAVLVIETLLADQGGTPVIVRRETLSYEDLPLQADSFVVERGTLAPIAARFQGIGTSGSADFAPGRVQGWTWADRRDTVDTALSGPVFLRAAMDLVLGALPLAEGWAAELAFFDAEEGESTVRVEVRALETVELPAGPVRAWRVRVRGSGSEGTYWMQEGTQTLVRFVAADRSMQLIRACGAAGRMAAR